MFARITQHNALDMDIHDIALTLFAQLVHANGSQPLSQEARIDMGREAYRFAEAYIAAKDLYIRELPVVNDQGF
ncbi:MAG TPA: hypothetical protein PL007_00440 [Thermomonas sp.]|jgi:hypothetical protein|nr:hypothetical protein [Thermomonas sp.]HQY48816.1 hypothetical protein [Thermomonas sp.]HRA57081.1 hypothetical protein [Thermomonas sp.]